MKIVAFSSCLLISYALGSLPWGYLLVRWRRGVDIRTAGSGNIGFTNVLRVAGKSLAAFTLLLDAGKGWLAVAFFAPWLQRLGEGANLEYYQIGAFVAAVGGHMFPVFLRFRGGKGVATGAGALLALAPPVFIICLGLWLLLVIAFRYVSLGSIAAAIAIPFLLYFFNKPSSLIVFTALLAALIIFKHRDNIKRLLSGRERRIGERAISNDETPFDCAQGKLMPPPPNGGVPPQAGKSE